MAELLINRMKKDFEKGGFKVKKDDFSDKSASWLTIYHKTNKDFDFTINFNYKGTKITDLDMFRKEYKNIITYFNNK